MITRSGTVEVCKVRAGSKLVSYNGMTVVLHPEEPAQYIHFDFATGKGELRALEPVPVDPESLQKG